MLSLRSGFVSVTGNVRENNEDRCLADPRHRYFLVADGMGGQSAGEKASELATELIPRRLEQLVDFDNDEPDKVIAGINDAISHANAEIMALGELEPQYHNMGTTVVFLVSVADTFFVGGVGDSRAYRLRGGNFEQLTKDHSLTQALVDAGTISEKDAETHRYRNVLYRYLGTKEGGTGTDPTIFEPNSGDRYVLCTDGVTDGIDEDRVLELLTVDDDPQKVAQAIVDSALEGGSRDNVTCVTVFVD